MNIHQKETDKLLRKNNMRGKTTNDAVSAIVGVLLMVAITIAIAVTVYYYVVVLSESADDDRLFVEGWTTEAYTFMTIEVSNETVDIWHITLSDDYVNPTVNTTYFMFFSNDLTGPPTDVEIRCYYEEYTYDGETYYDVTEVESL